MTLSETEQAQYERLTYPLPRHDATHIDLPSIQERLREVWEQQEIEPKYLLFRSEDRDIFRSQIGGMSSFRIADKEFAAPPSQVYLINQVTDARMEVVQGDGIAHDTMVFLYRKSE